jgi:hypothetical protein
MRDAWDQLPSDSEPVSPEVPHAPTFGEMCDRKTTPICTPMPIDGLACQPEMAHLLTVPSGSGAPLNRKEGVSFWAVALGSFLALGLLGVSALKFLF